MNDIGPQLTLGVEEEYLLVDKDTRALAIEPPDDLMKECEERLGVQVSTELLRSQIEIGTSVCKNVQEVREELVRLRGTVEEVANKHGLEPLTGLLTVIQTIIDSVRNDDEQAFVELMERGRDYLAMRG